MVLQEIGLANVFAMVLHVIFNVSSIILHTTFKEHHAYYLWEAEMEFMSEGGNQGPFKRLPIT